MTSRVLLGLILIATACGTPSPPVRAPAPDEPDIVPVHEVYLRRPTEIRGDEVHVILPRSYEEEIDIEGLSAGWMDRGGKRVWEGTGDCRLSLFLLSIECPSLTVTLVGDQPKPEVMIQATGDVSYRHSVKGYENAKDGLILLMITNNIVLER